MDFIEIRAPSAPFVAPAILTSHPPPIPHAAQKIGLRGPSCSTPHPRTDTPQRDPARRAPLLAHGPGCELGDVGVLGGRATAPEQPELLRGALRGRAQGLPRATKSAEEAAKVFGLALGLGRPTLSGRLKAGSRNATERALQADALALRERERHTPQTRETGAPTRARAHAHARARLHACTHARLRAHAHTAASMHATAPASTRA